MPYVFELDISYKDYSIGMVYKEVERLGHLGAYYHDETSVCVIGAKNKNEAIDVIFKYIVNDFNSVYEYFAKYYGDLIIQEIIGSNSVLSEEAQDELLDIWLEDDDWEVDEFLQEWLQADDDKKKPILDKYKNMLKLKISFEISRGLPYGIESDLKKELEEIAEVDNEFKRVDTQDFKNVPRNELIFIISRILEYLKRRGFMATREVYEGTVLNDAIIEVLDKAMEEARAQNKEIVEIGDFKLIIDDSINKSLFIKSRVDEYIKSKGFIPSMDVLNGKIIDKVIVNILDKAVEKAKKDKRTRVIGKTDFY